jgi:hypothetical protein
LIRSIIGFNCLFKWWTRFDETEENVASDYEEEKIRVGGYFK